MELFETSDKANRDVLLILYLVSSTDNLSWQLDLIEGSKHFYKSQFNQTHLHILLFGFGKLPVFNDKDRTMSAVELSVNSGFDFVITWSYCIEFLSEIVVR